MPRTLYLSSGWDIVSTRRTIYARCNRNAYRIARFPLPGVDLLGVLRKSSGSLAPGAVPKSIAIALLRLGILTTSAESRAVARKHRPQSAYLPQSGGARGLLARDREEGLCAVRAGRRVFFAKGAGSARLLYEAVTFELEACRTYADVVIARAALRKGPWPGVIEFWSARESRELDAVLTEEFASGQVYSWSPGEPAAEWTERAGSAESVLVDHPKVESASPSIHVASVMQRTPNLSPAPEGWWQPWSTAAGLTPQDALLRCVMEALETYATRAFLPPEGEIVEASWNEIRHRAVDPVRLTFRVADSERLRATTTRWCMTEGGLLVPLQLVGTRAMRPGRWLELPNVSTGGVAAHRDVPSARRNAALELCEREALAFAWYAAQPLHRVAESSLSPQVADLFDEFRSDGFEPVLLDATLDLVPVALLFVFDVTEAGRPPRKGSAARETFEAAALKAALEARAAHHFDDVGGPLSFARQVLSPIDHVRYYLNPRRVRFLRDWAWAGGSIDVVPVEERSLTAVLEAAGLTPLFVNLWSCSAPGKTAWVERAIIPDLMPLAYGYEPRATPIRVRSNLAKNATKRIKHSNESVEAIHPYG